MFSPKRANQLKAVLSAVAVAGIMLLVFTDFAQRMVAAAAAPFATVGNILADGVRLLLPGVGEGDEVKRLRAENAQLRAEVAESAGLRRDNQQLRSAVGLPPHANWRGVVAEVISRDPDQWYQRMVINRGSADGVATGALVMLEGKAFGRIVRCRRHTSEVATVLSPQCRFGVTLAGSNAFGVMTGNGIDGFGVTYLPRDLKAGRNQMIVTSGMGGWMPYGVPVGVASMEKNPAGDIPEEVRVTVVDTVYGKLAAVPVVELGWCRFVTVLMPQARSDGDEYADEAQ